MIQNENRKRSLGFSCGSHFAVPTTPVSYRVALGVFPLSWRPFLVYFFPRCKLFFSTGIASGCLCQRQNKSRLQFRHGIVVGFYPSRHCCICLVCPTFFVGNGNSFPDAFRLYLAYQRKEEQSWPKVKIYAHKYPSPSTPRRSPEENLHERPGVYCAHGGADVHQPHRSRYHTTREMDSIRIKDRRTWKRYSNGTGGDAITFLQEFCNKDFREAVNYLLEFNGCRARDSPAPRPQPVQAKERSASGVNSPAGRCPAGLGTGRTEPRRCSAPAGGGCRSS